MSKGRALTFSAHIALEFLVGLALCVAPFVLDFDDGATVVGLVLGILAITAALSTSVVGHAIQFHHALDRGLLVLLIAAAVVSLVDGAGEEAAVFGGAALVEAFLLAATRYIPETTHTEL
jgi:hypothetical protein